eukprot:CAMPEP_0119317770 /NCGR_PEP_ID=MMETSP1333-20130426/44268_1 /TAXON_ID=418940 /ORGANISM="Scyphosphaera apsteinii, Strain RCC1455" /LENGTH=421 /DNA_ID=CAMNT_0007323803 /DNA_START=34 /DNA_END=1299 /DNA_ORIENTATION=-
MPTANAVPAVAEAVRSQKQAPEHSYSQHRGYLPLGSDIMNGTFTLQHAQSLCDSISDCLAVTINVGNRAENVLAGAKHQMWLKSSSEWVPNGGHLTFVKLRPDCPGIEFKRMTFLPTLSKALHGPYCCQGAQCPDENAYATLEKSCAMPGATPLGVPRCSDLQGDPLENIALRSTNVSQSSDWPHAENKGANVAIDGVIDTQYFHTQCVNGPQWFRLVFNEPMMVAQVVLHNRRDHKARLVGASITMYRDNWKPSLSVRMTTARKLFVWTFRPVLSSIKMVEVAMPGVNDCLHFSELEVFGATQQLVDEGPFSFQRKVPATVAPEPKAAPSAPSAKATSLPDDASRPTFPDVKQVKRLKSSKPLEPEMRPSKAENSTLFPNSEAERENSMLMAASAGSATTVVLVIMQWFWIKAHWLDMWQ